MFITVLKDAESRNWMIAIFYAHDRSRLLQFYQLLYVAKVWFSLCVPLLTDKTRYYAHVSIYSIRSCPCLFISTLIVIYRYIYLCIFIVMSECVLESVGNETPREFISITTLHSYLYSGTNRLCERTLKKTNIFLQHTTSLLVSQTWISTNVYRSIL